MSAIDTHKREPLTISECVDISEILGRRSAEVENFAKNFQAWSGVDHFKLPESIEVALARESSRLRMLYERTAEHIITLKKP